MYSSSSYLRVCSLLYFCFGTRSLSLFQLIYTLVIPEHRRVVEWTSYSSCTRETHPDLVRPETSKTWVYDSPSLLLLHPWSADPMGGFPLLSSLLCESLYDLSRVLAVSQAPFACSSRLDVLGVEWCNSPLGRQLPRTVLIVFDLLFIEHIRIGL